MSNSVNSSFPWLDGALSGDELFYTRLVASTIHCPAAGQGFLVAFGLAIDSLEALSQAWVQNSIDISHIVQAVKNARACLITSTTLPSVVRSLPDLKPLPKSYSLWHSSVDKARSNSDARRVRQALGLTLLWHMGKGEEIGESISDALKILVDCGARRGHHSQFWKDIIPLIKPESTVLEGLSKEVRHDPIVKLLRTLAGYAVTCVIPVSPAVRYPEENSDEDLGSDTQTSGERSEDRYSQSETNEPEEDVLEEGSPIIRWQASRATRASWPQVLGLENWDIFSPPFLKAVLAHIPGSFANHDVSAYAILSAVSLVSALPARLALTLPSTQNDDIWVDIRNAHVCWSLAQLVPRTATSEKIWAGGHQPSQIVRLPLPKLAAVALNSKYINREPSGNLLALLFGDGAQTEDVLHEYGRFLRCGGATSDTPSSYSARIAYSFGAVVRQVSGNQVLAALASLDLRLSAPAELDYLCIREDAIANAVSGAFRYLGFGECVETPDPRYVGSPLCPRPEIVRDSLQQIRDEMSSIVGRVTPRMPISRFVKEFNRLSELSAKAFVILSAHRGSKLERSNFTSLYSSTEYLQLNDKLTQNNSTRIIPKISSVKSLLNGHLAALRSLAKRLAKEHPATADKINKISNLEKPFSLVFFTVEIDTVAALRPVKVEQQSIDGAETGMAKNGGRHFIVSELVRREVYAPLIRVITGHAREAAATFNPEGGLSPAEACEYLRPLLEDVYADVAPASWPSLLLPSSVYPRVAILPKTRRRGVVSELLAHCLLHNSSSIPGLNEG